MLAYWENCPGKKTYISRRLTISPRSNLEHKSNKFKDKQYWLMIHHHTNLILKFY